MSPAESTKLATRQWRCPTCGINVNAQHCPDCGERVLEAKDLTFMGLIGQVFQTVTTVLNSSVTVDRNFWLDPSNGNQYWVGVQYAEKAERKAMRRPGARP